MSLRVTLPNGLVLHGQPEMPTVGFFVKKDGLTWFDSVDVRLDETHRPAAHGSFDVPVTLGSRLVQVDGYCFAESEAALEHMGNQLKGVLADGGKGRVQVQWNGSTTWADVRLGAQTKFSPNRHSMVGEFQITFWAADPRKFGESHTFGPAASITAHHYGNFPAAPVLTVSGVSAGGYTVTGPGGRLFTVTRALVSGQPHTIDMASGYMRVGGAIVYGSVSRGDTWAVPPGVQAVMSVSGGSAVLTATVKDTYI